MGLYNPKPKPVKVRGPYGGLIQEDHPPLPPKSPQFNAGTMYRPKRKLKHPGPYYVSAYSLAVKEGYRGTLAEWLASLVGPQGEQGQQGIQGPQGPQGPEYDDTELSGRIAAIERREADWDAKSDFSGDYNDLTNKPTIPAAYDDTALAGRVSAIENREADWDGKQDELTDADKQNIADLHQDAVTSVNGQTGAVQLTASDVGAAAAGDVYTKSQTYSRQQFSSMMTAANLTATYLEEETTQQAFNDEVLEMIDGKQDTLTAGDNITIENGVISAAGGGSGAVESVNGKTGAVSLTYSDVGAVAFNDSYITNANTFYSVNGYAKTSTSTTNLPSVCVDSDRWGVIFFIAENAPNHTGTQMYFPIDGTYKGRIFYRSMVKGTASEWLILPLETTVVQALTEGTEIGSVNGTTLYAPAGSGGGGSNNLFIAKYGETTHASIKAAYDAGKAVFVKREYTIDAVFAPLAIISESSAEFRFSANYYATDWMKVTSEDVWTSGRDTVAARVNGNYAIFTLYATSIPFSSSDSTKLDVVLNGKQDTLTDADKQNIADLHQDAVSSVNGQTGAVQLDIPAAYDDTALAGRVSAIEGKEAGWNGKQDSLTAGDNITIENGVISASGGGIQHISPESISELLQFEAGIYVMDTTVSVPTQTGSNFGITGLVEVRTDTAFYVLCIAKGVGFVWQDTMQFWYLWTLDGWGGTEMKSFVGGHTPTTLAAEVTQTVTSGTQIGTVGGKALYAPSLTAGTGISIVDGVISVSLEAAEGSAF